MMNTSTTSVPALEVEQLTVRYGGFEAVSGLDLTVPAGAVQGLIGPNGAGKTSSFNAICGYVANSGGKIRVHGKALTRVSPYRAWHAGIGRTFQRVELFWTLTVREHIELAQRRGSKLHRESPSPDALLSMVGLEEVAGETVASLPLGTCRLVEFARAVATGASVILLDEPCSGLDRKETATLKDSLDSLRAELGLSLLIVEHDVEFILAIADRVSVLDNGRLIAEGTPTEVRASPKVRAAYLGAATSDSSDVADPDLIAQGAT